MRQILRVLLERDGIEVDIAEDGERATALLAEHVYAAVVLDLLMPREPFEARELRKVVNAVLERV